MEAPEREMPGIKAKDWKRPIKKDRLGERLLTVREVLTNVSVKKITALKPIKANLELVFY